MKRPLVFSMLAAAAMACNIGSVIEVGREALRETCYTVDRAEYERAATELGQTPETPEYPEVVTYEVCYITNYDEVSSVRMSEGYRPDDPPPADIKPTKDLAPQNPPSRTIPAGTYRGQFAWNADSIYTLDENEIAIVVSSSGEVSGEARFKYTLTESHNKGGGEQCTSYYEFWERYTLSGQVAGLDDKSIAVALAMSEVSDWSNCGRDIKRREDACTCQATIWYDAGLLTITCGTGSACGVYLTATK